MDPEIRAYLDETRAHFDVVADQMRGQLQVVAEGVPSLADRLDRLEQTLREPLNQVVARAAIGVSQLQIVEQEHTG